MAKKADAIGFLLAGAAPKGEASDEQDLDMAKERKLEAARAMMRAMKAGDAEAFAAAFKDAYDACAHASSYEDDETEDEE